MDGANATPEELLGSLDWIRGLVRSLIADPGAAEDVAQEAWLLAAGKPRASRAWIAVVARNLVRQRGRSEGSRRRREQAVARAEVEPSTADLVLRTERQALLVQAVTGLPEPYRSVVILRFVDGLEPTAIAERQGVAAGTIRSQLKRALDRLRTSLDAQFGDREAWGLALLPLAEISVGVTAPVSQLGLTAAAGWIMKKSIVIMLVCLGLAAGTYTFLSQRSEAPAAEAGGPVAGHVVGLLDGPLDDTGPEVAEPRAPRSAAPAPLAADRVPAVETEVPATEPKLALPSSDAGWWLTGSVTVPAGMDPGRTRIRVFAGDALGEQTPAALGSSPDGTVNVSLDELFRHPTQLVKSFQVELEHPECLPRVLSISTDRTQRQGGFQAAVRVEFPIDVALNPALYGVDGKVVLPAGFTRDGLKAALLARDGEAWSVLDEKFVGDDLQFSLRTGQEGDYLVVAWVHRGWQGPVLRLPRPAQEDVTLDGIQRGLELVLEQGLRIEGIVSGCPPFADVRWTVDATQTAAKRFPLQSLCYVGGRVENRFSEAIGASDGQFRIDGLGPNDYLVRVGRAIWGQEFGGTNWANSSAPLETVTAPATGVTLELDVEITGFEILSEGRPLDGVKAVARLANGSWTNRSGPDGRVLFLISEEEPIEQFVFSRTGLVERAIEPDEPSIAPGVWNPLELGQAHPGQLAIVIEGDPERLVEVVAVELSPLPGEEARELAKAERQARRITDSVLLGDILPGRYSVEIHGQEPVPGSVHGTQLAVRREVTIEPGAVTTEAVRFANGGRVRLSLDDLPGDSDPHFRLYGPGGEQVSVLATVRNRASFATSGGLMRRGPNVLEPALPPGHYRLEVWADDLPQRTVPVEVRAGEATDIRLR